MIQEIRSLRFRSRTERRLHFGCYNLPVPGWINTDVSSQILLSRLPMGPKLAAKAGLLNAQQRADHAAGVWKRVQYMDLSKPFPFATGTMEAIYSSHVMEHLTPLIAEHVIGECARILKPGGVFRVSVPDLDIVLNGYNPSQPDETVSTVFEIQKSLKDRHWWMYNSVSMARLLLGNGFDRAERVSYRQGACPDLDRLDNRPDVSLFMEAFKNR